MEKERFNQIIDFIYVDYLKTHEDNFLFLEDEMNLTKEQFVEKLTNNYGFGHSFDILITKFELTFDDKIRWVMKNTDVELENLYIVEEVYKPTTPTKLVRLKYKNEQIEFYE